MTKRSAADPGAQNSGEFENTISTKLKVEGKEKERNTEAGTLEKDRVQGEWGDWGPAAGYSPLGRALGG